MRKFLTALLSTVFLLAAVLFTTGCKGNVPLPDKIFYYADYGAIGDGETDDFEAIIATHEAANAYGGKATVKAAAGAVYYIGSDTQETAIIKTDVNWTDAEFIIDDTEIESYITSAGEGTPEPNEVNNGIGWRDSWIFRVASTADPYDLDVSAVEPFKKGQEQLSVTLPRDSVIVAVDSTTKRYIREGSNANNGADQQDVLIVRKDGSVDEDTPVIWDFDTVTKMTVYPIDETTLTLTGGKFTTWANQGSTDNSFMSRGIHITRSNTVVDGIVREIEKEKIPLNDDLSERLNNTGAPYTGFLYFENCADVTLQNSELCGHRAYKRASDVKTTRGNYDMQANRTVNLSVLNTVQKRDIKNSTWWGIFASNYSKNIYLDNVKWSRFDAHMGVNNATILNSELGHQGVQVVGSGTLRIENTTVYRDQFIHLRYDYGGTWEGDVILKNCTQVTSGTARIFRANGLKVDHDFGYPIYLPRTLIIDGFNASGVGNSSNSIQFFSEDWQTGLHQSTMPVTIYARNITRNGTVVTNNNGFVICSNMSRFNAAGTQLITSW